MKKTHNDVFTNSFMKTDFYKEQKELYLKNKRELDEKREAIAKEKAAENQKVDSIIDMVFPDNICFNKANAIALEIVKICRVLMERKDYTILAPICNQVVRSSTSVVANIAEGNCNFISAKDKRLKFTIAYKECKETIAWINFLYAIGELTEEKYNFLMDENMQIVKILSKSIHNLQNKINMQTKKR